MPHPSPTAFGEWKRLQRPNWQRKKDTYCPRTACSTASGLWTCRGAGGTDYSRFQRPLLHGGNGGYVDKCFRLSGRCEGGIKGREVRLCRSKLERHFAGRPEELDCPTPWILIQPRAHAQYGGFGNGKEGALGLRSNRCRSTWQTSFTCGNCSKVDPVVFCTFVPRFAFREFRRVMGEDPFRELVFGKKEGAKAEGLQEQG